MIAACRKPGLLIRELHRGREQLRRITADHQRREEYRQALVQQYGFLEDYLHDLADRLAEQGILIRSCRNFRGLGEGWFRTAIRLPEENDRLLQAMEEVLAAY